MDSAEAVVCEVLVAHFACGAGDEVDYAVGESCFFEEFHEVVAGVAG